MSDGHKHERQRTVVTVERMAPEGQALGRLTPPGGPAPGHGGPPQGPANSGSGQGKVIFVDYGAPGDRLQTTIEIAKSGFATGRIERVLQPGPGRIEAPCPYHFRPGRELPWCGGCDWQHLSAPAQLEAKRSIIVDCLRRIGQLPNARVEPVIASPSSWRYRNKVQVPFGTRGGRVVAGFYAPGSHEIVDFDDCPVQPELCVRIVRKVKELAQAFRWPIYEERNRRGWLRHLLVRVTQQGRAQATLVSRSRDFPQSSPYITAMREAFPEITGLFQNLQEEDTSVVLGPQWRKLWGEPSLEERVGRLKLRASPGAFLQVNTPACEKLYEQVSSQLTGDGFSPELVADVYCGVGAIALWLAPSVRRVLGVEENREAVADAWENARANGVRNARFMAGRAETLLGHLRGELERAEPGSCAAVVDPPRAGVAPAVLRALSSESLSRLIYVSCNPATFARDASALLRMGFSLKTVQPVDLFPQTSHIELSARFDRGQEH